MFQLTFNWWAVLLRGIVALLFGLTAFFVPGVTLVVVVSLFAAYSLLDGLFLLITGIRARKDSRRVARASVTGAQRPVQDAMATPNPTNEALPSPYPSTRRWWMLVLQGILSVGAGILTLVYPGIVAIALLYLIAAWAIATGVMEIVAAIRLRKEIKGEWMMILAGIASIALGVILIAQPQAGLLVWLWWIGAYALASGVLLIMLSFRLRKAEKENKARIIEVA